MESKIINKFLAEINGVKFNDERLYNSCDFLLARIEEDKKFNFNNQFVIDLRDLIDSLSYKFDEFSFDVLEKDFLESIDLANKLEEIEFKYAGSTWKIEWINNNLKKGFYNK